MANEEAGEWCARVRLLPHSLRFEFSPHIALATLQPQVEDFQSGNREFGSGCEYAFTALVCCHKIARNPSEGNTPQYLFRFDPCLYREWACSRGSEIVQVFAWFAPQPMSHLPVNEWIHARGEIPVWGIDK
jgi:hypothetical protein